MGKANKVKVVRENYKVLNAKDLHPNSRKAKRLAKKICRDNKMSKQRSNRNLKLQMMSERLEWFKENMNEDLEVYTHMDLLDLIEQYINRNKDEEDQITLKNSIGQRSTPNRQNASRADVLRFAREKDTNDFCGCGFDTVDLLNKEAVDYFKKWEGEMRMVSNIKLSRFTKAALEAGAVGGENASTLLEECVIENNENAEEEDCNGDSKSEEMEEENGEADEDSME